MQILFFQNRKNATPFEGPIVIFKKQQICQNYLTHLSFYKFQVRPPRNRRKFEAENFDIIELCQQEKADKLAKY